MDVVYGRCCGLDIHKKSITACVNINGKKEIRSFEKKLISYGGDRAYDL